MQTQLCLPSDTKCQVQRFISPLLMDWVDKDHKEAHEEYNDAKWTLNVLSPQKHQLKLEFIRTLLIIHPFYSLLE